MGKKDGTLAGLAALAGAAYLYKQQKDKDAGPKGKADTGPGYKSTETRKDEGPTADKETKRNILETITTPKEKSNDTAGNQGVIDSNSSSVKKPDDKKSDASSVANVKNANNNPAKPVVKRRKDFGGYGDEISKYAASVPAANTSASPDLVKRSREEAQAVIDQHKIDAATERKKRQGAKPYTPVKPVLATSSSGADIKAIADPDAAKAQYSRSMADQMRAKRDAENAEKIVNMKRKTEAFKNSRPNMEDQIRNTMSSTMKRGGAVKMASGGMAASRRGDGIAQRGKTRGKMC
jgi:hypothetical protein